MNRIVQTLLGLSPGKRSRAAKLPGTFSYGRMILPILLACTFFHFNVSAGKDTRYNEPGPHPGLQVNTYTGNLHYRRTDLEIQARGEIPLNLIFTYNSLKNTQDMGYGKGWSFNFGMWYAIAGSKATIGRGDGREDEFTWNGVSFSPPVGIHDTLREYSPGKFRLRTKHGILYYFDDPSHRKLTKIEDRNGNTIVLTYASGNPVVITDPAGRVLNLTWTGGRLSQVTDPNTTPSRIFTYQYDGAGRMVQVTQPLSLVYLYAYDSFGNMTGLTDPRSTSFTITYDGNKAVQSLSCAAVGYTKNFQYGICGNTTSIYQVVSGLNRQTLYRYDGYGRLITKKYPNGDSARLVWDANNNIIAFINEKGHTTTFGYDTRGNLELIGDGFSTTSTIYEGSYNLPTSHTDRNGNTTTYSYDSRGNRTGLTDCMGKTESYAWNSYGLMISETDKKGATTTYSYNANGYLTVLTDPLGHPVTNAYDPVGNLLSTMDKRGYTTNYTYDLLGRLIGTTDALSQTFSYVYDNNGNLTSEFKPNGYSYNYSYDAMNRRISGSSLLGGTTSYTYDEADNLKTETNPKGCTTTYTYDSRDRMTNKNYPLGYTETFTYSKTGRMLTATDKGGNTTSYQYDVLDRRVKKTDPLGFEETWVYDAGSNLTSYTDKRGKTTSYTHDCLRRPTVTLFPLGYSETSAYDFVGNVTGFTNKNGKTTTYTYDALGRRITETDPLGFTETYTYDFEGNRTGLMDKKGYATNYVYDALGRMVSLTDPLANTESYGYDPDGNRISVTDKNGHTTNYVYDGLDRLITKTDPLGHSEHLTYDLVGNPTGYTDAKGNSWLMSYNCLNRLTSSTDPSGFSDVFAYDAVGHLVSHTDRNGHVTTHTFSCCRHTSTTDPLGFIKSYGYDANGNRTMVTDEIGHVTTYTYDDLNRLLSVTSPMGRQTLYTYDGMGNILTRKDPNLNTITYTYSWRNQLLQASYPDATSASYSYDNAGNLVQVTNTGGIGDITTFAYDQLHRVTSETVNYGLFSKAATYTYDNDDNLATVVSPSGTISYVYDNAGRLISSTDQDSQMTSFQYDYNNNMVLVSYPNGVNTTMSYDALDRVIQAITQEATKKKGPVVPPAFQPDTLATDAHLFTIDCGVMQILSPVSGPGLTNHEVVTILIMNYGTTPAIGAVASYTINGGTPVTQVVSQPILPGIPLPFSFTQTANLGTPGQSYQMNACVNVPGDQNPLNNCMASVVVNQCSTGIYQAFTFEYDHVGNLVSEITCDETKSYQYNTRDELTREESSLPGNLKLYTYTPTGNRASKTVNGVTTSYAYNNDDAMIMAGGTTFGLDNNNNRVFKNDIGGPTTYQYGYKNELKHVTLPDLTFMDYKYSPLGNMLVRNENGVSSYIQSIPETPVDPNEDGFDIWHYSRLATYDNTGLLKSYFNPGLMIHSAGQTGYYHYNGYGSPTMQTNTTPALTATARYDAFGNTASTSGAWIDNNRSFFDVVIEVPINLWGNGTGTFFDPSTSGSITFKPSDDLPENWIAHFMKFLKQGKTKKTVGKKPTKPRGNTTKARRLEDSFLKRLTTFTNPGGILGGPGTVVTGGDQKKQKCCGVKSFVVKWSEVPDGTIVNETTVIAKIDVKIEFLNDEDHDPACCEYAQNCETHFQILDGPQKMAEPKGHGMQDDHYSRRNDHDGNKDPSDPGFTTDDNPGIKYLYDTPNIIYSFEAEQLVKEICPKPCPTGSVVAKRGPHKVTIENGPPSKDEATGLPATLDKDE